MGRRRNRQNALKWSILVREDVLQDGQRQRKLRRVPLGPASLTRAEAEPYATLVYTAVFTGLRISELARADGVCQKRGAGHGRACGGVKESASQ